MTRKKFGLLKGFKYLCLLFKRVESQGFQWRHCSKKELKRVEENKKEDKVLAKLHRCLLLLLEKKGVTELGRCSYTVAFGSSGVKYIALVVQA